MKIETLEIKTALQILKPIDEVFEAVIDPDKMSNYFISKSDNRIEEGKMCTWEFPEFPDAFPVYIQKVIKNEYISYYWDGSNDSETNVEMNFEPRDNNASLVTITEKSMPNNEAGIKWLKSNTEGWANFLACLKAFVEHGINLRKGSFDFMIKN